MTYATATDMIDNFTEAELVELTNRADPAATTISTDVLDQALAEAAAEMDAYIGARYDLAAVQAITPPPSNLVRLNCDIARYRLDADCTREPVIQRYEDAIKFLKNLVKGLVNLALPSTEEDDALTGTTPTVARPPRTFTPDTMRGF